MPCMKALILISIVFSLASCNTSIGLWRDVKAVSILSANKIKGAANNGSSYDDSSYQDAEYEYGAPVY